MAYVLARGNANIRKGEGGGAAADFDIAASLDPKVEGIEYLRGYAHRVAGNFDRARELLDKFLKQHPDHVDTLANLGFLSVEQGRIDEAEVYLRRVLELEPSNEMALYDYARVAIRRRDYSEAVGRLLQVVARDKANTQAHYQLFLAYSRLKELDKAQVELSEFKRLQTMDKQAKEERMQDEKLRTQEILDRP